jgi:hypothetical protein
MTMAPRSAAQRGVAARFAAESTYPVGHWCEGVSAPDALAWKLQRPGGNPPTIFGGEHRRIFCRPIPTVKMWGTGSTGKRNGVAEMTAVVSRERARATYLTGIAGLLMLAIAFVMMMVAAPGQPHGSVKPSTVQLTSDVCHQLTARSDSPTVRSCWGAPAIS